MAHLWRHKPSAAMLVALIALVVAASGTAMAASSLVSGDSLIKKHSLSGNRLRDHSVTGRQVKVSSLPAVPNAAHAISASTATNATDAADAAALGGQPASAFETASNVVRSGIVNAAPGQNLPLVTFGPFTLTLTCVNRGPAGAEAEILVTSTGDNSVVNGQPLPFTQPIDTSGPSTSFSDSGPVDAAFYWNSGSYLGQVDAAVWWPGRANLCIGFATVGVS